MEDLSPRVGNGRWLGSDQVSVLATIAAFDAALIQLVSQLLSLNCQSHRHVGADANDHNFPLFSSAILVFLNRYSTEAISFGNISLHPIEGYYDAGFFDHPYLLVFLIFTFDERLRWVTHVIHLSSWSFE